MGKNILMTGCSRSVGLTTKVLLESKGHKVFGIGLGGPDFEIDLIELARSKDDIVSAHKLFDAAEIETGAKIDVLINNAGMTRINWIESFPDEDWNDVMDLNLKVPFLLTREFIKRNLTVEPDDDLRVINVCSMAARYALRASVSYNCSKAGLAMMTKQLAKECANRHKQFSFFAVSPNIIEGTSMFQQSILELQRTRNMTREEAEKYVLQVPFGRPCFQSEVADTILWTVEGTPKFSTGANFELLGGMEA